MTFRREVKDGVERLFIDGVLRLEMLPGINDVIEGNVRRAEEAGGDKGDAEFAVMMLTQLGFSRHLDGVWRQKPDPSGTSA